MIKNCLKDIIQCGKKNSSLLKKSLDSEPVYNDKYIKTKIKIYNSRVNTNFHGNEMPEDNDNALVYL